MEMKEGDRRSSSSGGFFLSLLLLLAGGWLVSAETVGGGGSRNNSLCATVIRPLGYPCFECAGGDTWFANCIEEPLGFILADSGFDVWVGNVRGTHWSHRHVSLSESNKLGQRGC